MGIETLQIRLSNGAANTDPTISYGGVISSTVVLSQDATATSSLGGVALVTAAGNAVGVGTLSYVAATKMLSWKPPGDSYFGSPVYVASNGTYVIRGATATSGYVTVTITSTSLSALDATLAVTIANTTEKIFNDVSKDVAYAGLTDYRCLYIMNTGASTAYDVKITLDTDTPGVDTLTIRGPANAVNTAETVNASGPGGTYYGVGVPVTLGNIPNGQYWGFWIKRVVTVGTVDGYAADSFRIKLTALV